MMGCCKEKIICHMIKQIGSNSACSEDLCNVIPAFWDLVCIEAGGSCHLHALLTKREAILFLLGCEAYSVDVAESHFEMTGSATGDTRSDYNSQMQSTGSSNKFAIGTGNTKYDEKSTSQSDYNSLRKSRAKDTSDGSSFYRDDGRGFGFNRQEAFNATNNRVDHQSFKETDDRSFENGSRNDCNYEYSTNNTVGESVNFIIIGGSFTGSASEWRKYSRTNAASDEIFEGLTLGTGTERDTGLSTSRGTHRWESTFYSDVEWIEQEKILRFHNERFDSHREASTHSDGQGEGIYEEKTRSHNAAQGTVQAFGDSLTARTATRLSNETAFAVSNSQRFSSLMGIYDQLNEQIMHTRKRIRASAKPVIEYLACSCKSDCCCAPQLRSLGREVVHAFTGTTKGTCCPSMLQ